MKVPLVSCVIPVYNGERFLGEAIDSVLAQTQCRLQVVVVDDGSTDGTAQLVKAYGNAVEYTWQPNAGPASALHRGFPLARGEFVASLDADDLWLPSKIAQQLGQFAERAELGISLTHIKNFWDPEVAEEEQRLRDHPRAKPLPGYTFGTMLAKQNVLADVGLPDPTRQHGYAAEWFMRVRDRRIGIRVLPDVLVLRRLHRANRSRQRAAVSRDNFLDLLRDRLDRQRGRSPGHGAKDPGNG